MRSSGPYTGVGSLVAEPAALPAWSRAIWGGRPRWKFWIVRGSLSILDQGLIAASNFLISILLARWLLPEQYGGYALAFAVFLLLSSSYQAVLLEPQRVFGPSSYSECLPEYLGILLRIHVVLALAIFIVLGISAWLTSILAAPSTMPGALAGVSFAAPCVLLLWLTRGAFYVRMSPQHAVRGAAVYCALVLGGLLTLYRLQLLSAFTAFLLMGLGALVSSSILLVYLRPVVKAGTTGPTWRTIGHQHWNYGRWVLASQILSWVGANIYYPLIGSLSGMASVAALKVLFNLVLPVAQTFSALSMFFLPYVSRAFQEHGVSHVRRLTWKIVLLFVTLAVAYWGSLILLGKQVMHLLYGDHYTELVSLLPLLAAAWLPWNIVAGVTVSLQALQSPASVFGIYCASSMLALLVGVPSTWAFGLQGALWSTALSNLAALLVAFFVIRRKLQSSSSC